MTPKETIASDLQADTLSSDWVSVEPSEAREEAAIQEPLPQAPSTKTVGAAAQAVQDAEAAQPVLQQEPEIKHGAESKELQDLPDLIEMLRALDSAQLKAVYNPIFDTVQRAHFEKNRVLANATMGTEDRFSILCSHIASRYYDKKFVKIFDANEALEQSPGLTEALALNGNKNIEEVFLVYGEDSTISLKAVQKLAEMLKGNKAIKRLDLSNSGLTDEGLKIIADVLRNGNSTLEYISLFGNKISDAGAREFESIFENGQNTTLKGFDLRNNPCDRSWGYMFYDPTVVGLFCEKHDWSAIVERQRSAYDEGDDGLSEYDRDQLVTVPFWDYAVWEGMRENRLYCAGLWAAKQKLKAAEAELKAPAQIDETVIYRNGDLILEEPAAPSAAAPSAAAPYAVAPSAAAASAAPQVLYMMHMRDALRARGEDLDSDPEGERKPSKCRSVQAFISKQGMDNCTIL